MLAVSSRNGRPQDEQGFALIMAILALMLLTFLGLTLATTTSQELQIASNYRWNQQALYNAEAGLEVGKLLLQDLKDDADTPSWVKILPPRRMNGANPLTWTVPTYTTDVGNPGTSTGIQLCTNCGTTKDAQNRDLRNFENYDCDSTGGKTGYGVVLNPDGNTPYQYVTNFAGHNVNGAFTIWVRRKTEVQDGYIQDVDSNDVLVMTIEGIAPYRAESATSTIALTNRAVKYLEFDLARQQREHTPCGTRAGQAGAGPEGANFGGCVEMDPDRVAEGLGYNGTLTDSGKQ